MAIPDATLHLGRSRNSAVVHSRDNERILGSAMTGNVAGCNYVATPKFKRRKVSAVRDFPPGCGRFAELLNSSVGRPILINREEDMAKTSDALPINPEFGNECQPAAELGEMVGVHDKNEKPGDLVNGHCSPRTEELDSGRLVNTKEDSQVECSGVLPMAEIVADVQNNVVELDDIVVPPAIDSRKKSTAPRYPPRRRVSAVRDFPPFCGRNAPIVMKEEGTSKTAACLPKDGDLGEDNPPKDGPLQGSWPDDSQEEDENFKTQVPQTGELVETDVGAYDGELHVEPGPLAMVLWRNEDESNGSPTAGMAEADAIHSFSRSRNEDESNGSPAVGMAEEDALDSFAKSPMGGNQEAIPFIEDTIDNRNSDFEDSRKPMANEVMFHADVKGEERSLEEDKSKDLSQRKIVLGIMASPNSPWKKMNKGSDLLLQDGWTESKGKKVKEQLKSHSGKKKSTEEYSRCNNTKEIILQEGPSDADMGQMVVWEPEDSSEVESDTGNFYVAVRPRKLSVNPPRLVPDSLGSEGDNRTRTVTRNKVRETLRLFQTICRRLLQEEEMKSKHENRRKRVDLPAAKIMREKGKFVNTGKPIMGVVPGVEVGDEFQYRVELNVIGLHRAIQAGIDYVKDNDKILATSVVSSGAYEDVLEHSDFLIYTGQGGNVVDKDKEPEDQKLEKGNLALYNSMSEKTPVRVIRGLKEKRASSLSSDSKNKVSTLYTYDGLYMVERTWQEVGQHGKLVYKFQLNRMPGQPELAWKVVNKSKRSETREGLCMRDISQGKERMPIGAVNTIDNEKPPQFTYVTQVIYPNWCRRLPPTGCNCSKRCSDSVRCSCAVKNGGEIPYNHDGAIVDAKPLVYECGPSCKCPPSCHNRVSQHGIKIPLEIFKTESRGWGVRSLASISSGSFICEYIGELLDDKQADQMTGNDEYLFDIGNNYNDGNMHEELSNVMPDAHLASVDSVEEGGFTIDALKYGNAGRFINHSCSPNLYAQNVLYDHDDKRIPHIMLFAAENIPPLQELTYHYNYVIDQVRDSEGNIKKKSCFCGSPECTGRMY